MMASLKELVLLLQQHKHSSVSSHMAKQLKHLLKSANLRIRTLNGKEKVLDLRKSSKFGVNDECGRVELYPRVENGYSGR